MKILELEQGSQAWNDARLQHRTASEAPLMMGDSTKGLRNELLRLKKTGESKEVSAWVQRNLYDKGHRLEAMARELLEQDIGEDLFPIVAADDDGWLMASVDGMTMCGSILFEHKGWNDELADMVRSGELEPEYYWQLEQQLHITGADKVIFVVSDGTRNNRVMLDYYPVPGRIQQLLAGWRQFDADLEVYEPAAPVEVVKARSIENLPALVVKLSGGVSASNLEEYKAGALAFIGSISTDLATDQDFADAEATVKFCDKAEKELAAIKDKALEDTRSIKELFDTIDEISATMREKRLVLNKLVTSKKEEIKASIRTTAEQAFANHVAAINAEIGPRVALPAISCDIAGAMKGKRSITSLQDAADTTLSKAKIEANALADKIRANLKVLRDLDAKYRALFADAQTIILKDAEDFANLVQLRVKEFDAEEERKAKAEEERQAQERERIRQEEQQRLQSEQQQREEEKRQRAAEAEAAATPAPEPTPDPEPAADSAPTASKPIVTGMDPASGKDQTVYHTTAPATVGKRKSVATLVNMDALLGDIMDGVMPMDLVQIHPEAVQAFVDHHGFAPTGFTLSSAE